MRPLGYTFARHGLSIDTQGYMRKASKDPTAEDVRLESQTASPLLQAVVEG
jgi:hypothetical protein